MSSDTAYITFLGRSVWALLNSYYAVLRKTRIRPTMIYVFGEEIFASQVEMIRKGLLILSDAYGATPKIEIEILKTANYLEACRRIPAIIHDLKMKGMQVALDITPGRKALVAGALIASRDDLDHIYYLAISSTEDAAKPYMMIPLSIQELKDFTEEVKACEEMV